MRPITAAQRTLLAAPLHRTHVEVRVENPDGVMTPVTSLDGTNWFRQARWSLNLDRPVMVGAVTLAATRRDGASLIPTRGDSPLNRNAANQYARLLDAGRRIEIRTAITDAAVTTPAAGDWRSVFEGYLDDTEIPEDARAITLPMRDLGAVLADRKIEAAFTPFVDASVPVETAIQQVLDHVFGNGVIPLYTPVSPGVGVTKYEQKADVSVLEAIRELAFGAGCDVRYRYDAAGAFRLTLWIPDRSKTVPDATIAPTEYFTLPRLNTPIENVRNVIEVEYLSSTGDRLTQTYVNQVSVDAYRRRWMKFTAGPGVTTAAQALDLGTVIGQDLGRPLSEQDVRLRHWWPVQLGDLYRFEANGTHYNTPQDLAVVGAEFTLERERSRTVVQTRGNVAGAYSEWIRRGNSPPDLGPAPAVPTASIWEVFSDGVEVRFNAMGNQVGGTGALEWQLIEWTDGQSPPAWPAAWETAALPIAITVARPFRLGKQVGFRVRDAGGRVSEAVYGRVLSSFDYLTDTGALKRTAPFDDGGWALGASNSAGTKARPATTDDRDTLLTGHFNVPTQTTDDLNQGTVRRTVSSGAVDASGNVDFAGGSGWLNRHAGHLARSAGNATAMSTVAQHLADTGHAAATMRDDRLTLLAQHYDVPTQTLDVIQDGSAYKLLSTKGRSQLFARRPSHGANLLPNPGFEDFGAFWTSGPGVSFNDDYTAARSGNRYLTITRPGAENYGSSAADETGAIRYFEVEPGDVIQFGGYGVRASGDATVRVTLGASDRNKGSEVYTSTAQAVGGSYTECWAEYTVPAGIQYVRVYAEIIGGAAASTARFDDLWLSVLRKAEDLAAGNLRSGVADDRTTLLNQHFDVPTQTLDAIAQGSNQRWSTPVQIAGSDRAYTGLSGNGEVALPLPVGIGQYNGAGSMQIIAKGILSGEAAHGAAVTFPAGMFANPPLVLLSGGMSLDPRSRYGPSGNGLEFGAYDATKPTIPDLRAQGLTAAGFTMSARLRQPGTVQTRNTHNFPLNNNLSTTGQTTEVTLTAAPASDDTYTAHFKVALTANAPSAGAPENQVRVTVAVDLYDAGNWVFELGAKTYVVAAKTIQKSQTWAAETIAVTRAGISSTEKIRLRLKSVEIGPDGGTVSVHGFDGSGDPDVGVHYVTSADQYAPATDTVVLAKYVAIEVTP